MWSVSHCWEEKIINDNLTSKNFLLVKMNRQIGELNAYSLLIPNVDLYIKIFLITTGMKFTTLVGVINAFQEKQILIETTGYSRNQVFAFQKYIDLFLK